MMNWRLAIIAPNQMWKKNPHNQTTKVPSKDDELEAGHYLSDIAEYIT